MKSAACLLLIALIVVEGRSINPLRGIKSWGDSGTQKGLWGDQMQDQERRQAPAGLWVGDETSIPRFPEDEDTRIPLFLNDARPHLSGISEWRKRQVPLFYNDHIPSFFHDEMSDEDEESTEKRQAVPVYYNKDMGHHYGIWKKEILNAIAKELRAKDSSPVKDQMKKSEEEEEKKNIK